MWNLFYQWPLYFKFNKQNKKLISQKQINVRYNINILGVYLQGQIENSSVNTVNGYQINGWDSIYCRDQRSSFHSHILMDSYLHTHMKMRSFTIRTVKNKIKNKNLKDEIYNENVHVNTETDYTVMSPTHNEKG